MVDIASLAFEVDSRELKRGERDLDSFGRSGVKTSKRLDSMSVSAVKYASRLAGIGSAAVAAGAALRATQSYLTMANSLRAIGLTADQSAAALEQVAAVAQRTRAPLEATASLYQRISIAGRDLGASSSDVLRFTENISLGLAQTGGSAAAASGALTQLSQAMAGGVVRAEEFNSILEGAFPIAQAAANGIDGAAGSVGRLRNMVVEGEISSREFFDAILSQTDELEAAFANTVPTISQAVTSLSNNFIMLSGSMDQTLGVSSAIAQGILLLSDNLDRVATYAVVAAAAVGVKYGGAMAIAAARTVTLSGALAFLRGAIIRTGIGALVIAAGELTYRFMNLVKATGSFGAAMGLLGNVAAAVWQGIIDSASAIPPALSGVWQSMKAGFMHALAGMATAFHDFVWSMGAAVSQIPGLEDLGSSLTGLASQVSDMSGNLARSGYEAQEAASGSYANAAATIQGAFGPARDAVAALQSAVVDSNAEISAGIPGAEGLAAAIGDGEGGSGGGKKGVGGAAKGAAAQLSEFQKAVEGTRKSMQEMKDQAAVLSSLEGDYANMADAAAYVEKKVELLTAARASEMKITTAVMDQVSKLAGEYAEQSKALQDLEDDLQKAIDRQKEFNDLGEEFIKGMVTNPAEALSGLVTQGADAFGKLVADALDGSKSISASFNTAFSDISKGIGSVMGGGGLAGIGQALSGALPIIGGITSAFNLIKGFSSSELIGAGISGNISANSYASDYERTKKTKFWGLTSSTSLDQSYNAELAGMLNDAASTVRREVSSVADAFGGAAGNIKKVYEAFDLDTAGMSAEEATAALSDELDAYREKVAQVALGTDRYTQAGESAVDTLSRLTGSLSAFNDVQRVLGLDTLPKTIANAQKASRALEAAGGAQAFNAGASTLFDNMSSRAQERSLRRQAGRRVGTQGFDSLEQLQRVIEDHMRRNNDIRAAELTGIAPLVSQIEKLRFAREQEKDQAKSAAAASREIAKESAASALATRQSLRIQLAELQGYEGTASKIEYRMFKSSLEGLSKLEKSRAWAVRRLEKQISAEQELIAAREAAAAQASAIADERSGLMQTLMQGRENQTWLDKQWLSGLDASNKALGQKIIAEREQRTAQEELARASEEATNRLREMIGALDPSEFATRFEFQRAQSGLQFGNPNLPSYVPPTTVGNTDPSQGNAAMQSEIKGLREDNRQLLIKIERNTAILVGIEDERAEREERERA